LLSRAASARAPDSGISALGSALSGGFAEVDRLGAPVRYRYVDASDDVAAITRMLHEAYAPLAAAGMRFLASHQDEDTTRSRLESGETLVAIQDEVLAGIVTLSPPSATRGAPCYERPGVASFGQFAVRPSHQRRGIGTRLLDLVELRARELGATELALDTSENAAGLIALYESRGFRTVEYVQWDVTNYRSVILAKRL
jgi:GNAT superfamily N-acetyltransferase